jgi:hypothetical protein
MPSWGCVQLPVWDRSECLTALHNSESRLGATETNQREMPFRMDGYIIGGWMEFEHHAR